MDIDAVIAALGGRFAAAEVEVIERVLREYGGTVPDPQLISEAALTLMKGQVISPYSESVMSY